VGLEKGNQSIGRLFVSKAFAKHEAELMKSGANTTTKHKSTYPNSKLWLRDMMGVYGGA
jgi:hypothetical protein